jgi:hypothetical protein
MVTVQKASRNVSVKQNIVIPAHWSTFHFSYIYQNAFVVALIEWFLFVIRFRCRKELLERAAHVHHLQQWFDVFQLLAHPAPLSYSDISVLHFFF